MNKTIVSDDIKKTTAVCLDDVKAILQEVWTTMDKVLKPHVFIKDMNGFAAMNEVYATYFNSNPPARSLVQPAKLQKDALIEIEVIAVVE